MDDDDNLLDITPLDKKANIIRRKEREFIRLCPKCLEPVSKVVFFIDLQNSYKCSNPECEWVGSVIIEVDKTDYKDYLLKYKNKP